MLKIECCNLEMSGRFYNIGDNSFLILAECPICGKNIAEIRTKNAQGVLKTITRRSGAAAERLYDKYVTNPLNFDFKVHSGTRAKEYEFYNYFGVITNGNGVRITNQDNFMGMSREEINAVVNKRYYKARFAR